MNLCNNLMLRLVAARHGRSAWLLGNGTILVDRILAVRRLHFDINLHGRLLHVKIFAVGLEAMGQNLHSQFAIRNAIEAGFAFGIRFQFQSTLVLTAIRIDGMKHNRGIADGFAVVIFHDHKTYGRRRWGWLLLARRSSKRKQTHAHENDGKITLFRHASIVARSVEMWRWAIKARGDGYLLWTKSYRPRGRCSQCRNQRI